MASVSGALAFAFSLEFWEQSVIVEVYTLNALLVALCIFILIRWQEIRKDSLLYTFAFVYGLGLCNHHTMHFLGPAFAAYILFNDFRNAFPPHAGGLRGEKAALALRVYALMLAIAAGIWFIIHLYLPIRSLANPPIDWGNPETLESFWNVVTRRQYIPDMVLEPQTLHRFVQQLYAVLVHMHVPQFTLWLALVPLLGLYPLWRHQRRRFALIFGIQIYLLLGIVYFVNFDVDTDTVAINSTFFIPVHMLSAVLIGLAVAWIAAVQVKKRTLFPVAVVLSILAPLIPLLTHYQTNDKSNYYFAHDYAMNLFETLDKDAVFFPVQDYATFPLQYFQIVEGVRPDVSISTKYGYIEGLSEELTSAQLTMMSPDAVRHLLEDKILSTTDRPIYFTTKRPLTAVPNAAMVNAGLLFRVVGEKWPYVEQDYWSRYTWHTLDEAEARGDFTARSILGDYHLFHGQRLLQDGNLPGALDELEATARLMSTNKHVLNNLGSTCLEHGLIEHAQKYYQMAVEVDPEFEVAYRNLVTASTMLGDLETAGHYAKTTLAITERNLGPNNVRVGAASNELGVVLLELGKPAEALKLFKRAVKIDQMAYGGPHPVIARDLNNIGGALLALNELGDAKASLERAIAMDTTVYGPEHVVVARDRHNLGLVLDKMGDKTAASQHRQWALRIIETYLGAENMMTRKAKEGRFIPALGE